MSNLWESKLPQSCKQGKLSSLFVFKAVKSILCSVQDRPTIASRNAHIRQNHAGLVSRSNECLVCGGDVPPSFESMNAVLKHLKEQHAERLEEVGLSVRNISDVRFWFRTPNHVQPRGLFLQETEVANAEKLTCQHCGKKVASAGCLSLHILHSHGNNQSKGASDWLEYSVVS